MRRKLLVSIVCVAAFLQLSGCTARGGTVAERLRELYRNASGCEAQAAVRADFGDRVFESTLSYSYSRDGDDSVTVLKPDELSGVRALIKDGQTSLEFDGIYLETGTLPGTDITPLYALPALLSCWQEGYVSSWNEEKVDGVKTLRLEYRSSDDGKTLEKRSWFDAESLVPLRAEIYSGGFRVLSVEYELFTIT